MAAAGNSHSHNATGPSGVTAPCNVGRQVWIIAPAMAHDASQRRCDFACVAKRLSTMVRMTVDSLRVVAG
jgi:hypothetical protein